MGRRNISLVLFATLVLLFTWSGGLMRRNPELQQNQIYQSESQSQNKYECICPTIIATPAPAPLHSEHVSPQKLPVRSTPLLKIYQAFADRKALRSGHNKKPAPTPPMTDVEYWSTMALIFCLVLLGGMFAGLTIGLMSIDETNLRILKRSGTPTEKIYAERIEPIRKNAHLLLVTLLLSNTVVNETLPILFGLVDLEGYQAVLFSTILVLVFGEIIPQAICARYGLRVGAIFAWPVRILIWILFIIAFPIAKLLDYILGHKDGVIYRRAELKELIAMHDEDHHGPLTHEEVSILRSVLELRGKTAENVMTKLDDVLMLSLDAKLDESTMAMLLEAGHSRVPVYNQFREDIIGVCLVKQLILLDPEDCIPVYKSRIGRLPRVKKDTPLFEILHVFEDGRSHMAVVVDEVPLEESLPNTIVTASPLWIASPHAKTQRRFSTLGVITLEDVIEELIGQEIVDETDVYVSNNTKVKVGRMLEMLSRENSAFMVSPLLGSTETDNTESRPLLSSHQGGGLTAYGATSSSAKPPPVTPRMRAVRKFRETLVPAHEILQEISTQNVAPVFGFEAGQRILISDNGDIEVDVPHLALDQSITMAGSKATRKNLESLD
ncbi:hypothetical protein HK100_005572 [Physocladia obscura]|uniref:CNNM transmembrane domain-containing protein n=1 Tax=Physocladia obscura TaxID=109957 RepID=A0AAD5XL75_9FUNG|nr:hypothetical protein HK100_005572 [Physocladia obscura]